MPADGTLSLVRMIADRSESFVERRLARQIAQERSAPDRREERLGNTSRPRPRGAVLWVHVCPGQDLAGLSGLILQFQAERPEVSVLLTGRFDLADGPKPDALPPKVICQSVPADSGPPVRRFLDHWRPDVAAWLGLGLRPVLLAEARDRAIPMILADGHLPVRDGRWCYRVPGLPRRLLSGFERVIAADDRSGAFLRRRGAGAERLHVLGHLADGTTALPCNETDRAALARALGARPVWLASAFSEGEETLVLTAHQRALRRAHRLLLIALPAAHPDRFADRVEDAGLTVARWSDGDEPAAETQVLVADDPSELGLWYRLAPITFLGQTIVAGSGGARSPWEPAALGSALLHGPLTGSFPAGFAKLAAASATVPVRNALELGNAIDTLTAPDRAAALAHAAWDVVTSGADVSDHVLALLLSVLDARERA